MKTLRIHLKSVDSELVLLYRDMISPDARTFTKAPHLATGRNKQIITASESFGVEINSTFICNDLVRLGYGYNKSKSDLSLPSINKSLIRHFIRGYFDGDGSFSCILIKELHKNPRIRVNFSICSKTRSLLEEIQDVFSNNNLNTNIYHHSRDDMYGLSSSSKQECVKIFHYLYDDSYFYLTRKFNKFNHFVNTEESQLIAEFCNAQKVNVNESNNPSKSAEHPIMDEDMR